MLTGRIKAKLENDKFYAYDFVGEDTPASLTGTLSTFNYEAQQFMAGDYDSNNAISERQLEIRRNTVKVSRAFYTNARGKKQKYGINDEFFLKLGALIQYAKSRCNQNNSLTSYGLANASGEFEAEPVTKYQIKCGTSDKILGTVELRMGALYSCHIENDNFCVDLDDDGTLPREVFKQIKDSTRKGFLFNKDFLDFDVESSVSTAVVSGLYSTFAEVVKAHPEKELEWLLNMEYTVVTDDMLDSVIEEFNKTDDFVYFDTETSGLRINFKSRTGDADQCVGIILSKDDGISYFFPMQMKYIKNLCGGDHWFFMEKYIRPILENKKIVAHNLAFDWRVAHIYGIDVNFVDDTQTMLVLTYAAEMESYPTSLKEASKELLHHDSLELSDLVVDNSWGENDIKFWDLPEELAKYYACADTDNTRGIHRYFIDNDILQRYNAKRIYDIEVAFAHVVAYQMFYGHMVDVENVDKLKSEVIKEINDEKEKMVELIGHDFNPNSPSQLVKIMYEEQNIPVQINRKTGRPATDKDVLKDLGSRKDINGNYVYPFAAHMQKFRKAEGIRKIIAQYDEKATSDGFIFSDVYQYGTTTGRVSIKEPNYQSYNDAVKKHIKPRPGFYMADTDYSSVEYRVLANMAGNESIKNGFIDPDFDYHTYQAARMYSVPYSAVTSTLRKAAKGINFGIPYGMGDESLGMRVYGVASRENTAKAKQLREKYFLGQEDIKLFFDTVRNNGVKNGYTETYFGRRRYYRRSKFSESAIRRQAGNAVIQGTAADIYKLAVSRTFARIRKEGWLGLVLLSGFIHDELLIEIHNSIDPMVFLKALREEFEVAIEGWCPLYMGFGFGMSWYDAKKTEIPIQLQWEMVKKWGTTGYDKWNHDGTALYADVLEMLRDYSVRHCEEQLVGEEYQGKEIKPATNTALADVCKEDKKLYTDTVLNILKKNNIPMSKEYDVLCADENFVVACTEAGHSIENIKAGLVDDKTIRAIAKKAGVEVDFTFAELQEMASVQSVLLANKEVADKELQGNYVHSGLVVDDASGVVILDLFKYFNLGGKVLDTQLAIDMFCRMHKIDRKRIDVKSIDTSASITEENVNTSESNLSFDENEEASAEQRKMAIDARVKQLGMYLDTENNEVILQLMPNNWLGLLKAKTTKEQKGYKIRFRDYNTNTDFLTESYIPYNNVTEVQQLYINYIKMASVTRK